LGQHMVDDYWYDGHVFRNYAGKCLDVHPNMKLLIELHLKEINEEILKENKAI
jgi:hypothetical protein